MYKTLGGYHWNGMLMDEESCSIDGGPVNIVNNDNESILKSAQEFHIAVESLKSVR